MFREGLQIGLYTLVRKLGKGGFGEVWLADKQSQFFTKKVAVKLPHDEMVNFDAIRREATLWEEASGHPNVLPIIDAGIYDGQVVIVSEYASGGSLGDKLLAEGKLSIQQAVETVIGILSGLDYLHSKGIIHRDIKPQNVLLQGDTPRLADFGISRAMNTSTISSLVVGTDAYMSPEAFDGKRNGQTDIWSVGVVLYQLLKGDLPFPQAHPSERLFAILTKEFEPLTEEFPSKLREISQKALAKNPQARYQTAAEMREDLQKALVNINHPTFAPTEILRQPLALDFQTDAPTIETNEPIIQTNKPETPTIQSETQAEQQTLDAVKPTQSAIQPDLPAQSPSVVTQIKPPPTAETPKPLPTVAQALADRTHDSRSNKILYYAAGAGVLFLLLFLGSFVIYNLSPSKKIELAPNSNTATNSSANSNAQSNTATNSLPADGRLIPYRKSDKWGFVDGNKKFVIEPKYEDASPFYEDLASVELNGKYGFIDKNGNEAIPFKFDFRSSFKDGLALVIDKKSNDNALNTCCYGFVDKTGNQVIPFKLKDAHQFYEGLAKVSSGWRQGYIDSTGKLVIPVKYWRACDFSEGLACVEPADPDLEARLARGFFNTSKAGFIDTTGRQVIPLKFDGANSFSEGLAAVQKYPKWGFIDKSGNQVIEFKYDDAREFGEGITPVKLNEKWGFIDKTGKEVIPFKYEYVRSLTGGLAAVRLNGKWGFVDKNGNEAISFKYASGADFSEGLARVQLNDKEFYIDKNGTEYYEP